jgi:hypothetical protein
MWCRDIACESRQLSGAEAPPVSAIPVFASVSGLSSVSRGCTSRGLYPNPFNMQVLTPSTQCDRKHVLGK